MWSRKGNIVRISSFWWSLIAACHNIQTVIGRQNKVVFSAIKDDADDTEMSPAQNSWSLIDSLMGPGPGPSNINNVR